MNKLVFDRPRLVPVGSVRRLVYDWTVVFRGEYYHLPSGVVTDGASIPRWLRWLCGEPMDEPRVYAAIVHDWLYSGGDPEATRADADDLYRDLQIALGIPRWRAYIEWAALRIFGGRHFATANKKQNKETKMHKTTSPITTIATTAVAALAIIIAAAVLSGCQTRITAEKNAEVVNPIQQVVTVGDEQRVITTGYLVTSGGWYATARSPLWADETLKGLEIGVETNGAVRLALGDYKRDLSTNAVAVTHEMIAGGADLVTAIADCYVKIAGGGAQVSTVLSAANTLYGLFESEGGDAAKATVSATDAGKVRVSDGETCVECDPATGKCAPCGE